MWENRLELAGYLYTDGIFLYLFRAYAAYEEGVEVCPLTVVTMIIITKKPQNSHWLLDR